MKLPVPPNCNHILMLYLSQKTKLYPPCSPFSWKAVPIHLPLWTLRPTAIFLFPWERLGLCAFPEGPDTIKEVLHIMGKFRVHKWVSAMLGLIGHSAKGTSLWKGCRQMVGLIEERKDGDKTNWLALWCLLTFNEGTRFHHSKRLPLKHISKVIPLIIKRLWQKFVDQ